MENKLKVVTFNLRCNVKSDGINSFDIRRGSVLAKIDEEAPDIIGFQELTPPMMSYLIAHLPKYNIVGRSRTADFTGEHVDIAYRKSTVDLHALDYFWLSPTPQVPGSRYKEQSGCPRITTVGIFKHRNIKTPFRIYNTHLDHEGEQARVLGMSQILERISKDNVYLSGSGAVKKGTNTSLPFFVLGDFNALPDSECINLARSFKDAEMVDLTADIPVTFHGYGKTGIKIDYIFADSHTASNAYKTKVWDDCNFGVYLSDHYPICTEIDVKSWQ